MRLDQRKHKLMQMRRNWLLYLFLLPAIVYIAVFSYAPMYGLQIAFKNFRLAEGITGSEWVGLKWFKKFIESTKFLSVLKNTLTVSIYSLVVNFPLPIILALILNNVKNAKFKKFAQTITYLPHFISVVVLVGMMSIFFSPNSGIIVSILRFFGVEQIPNLMGDPDAFKHMYVWSDVWQSIGWNSIIYMAALTGVDPALHEAAKIDGANKLQRIWNIDLPAIMPTMAIMLIMSFGKIMSVGYEKVYLMQNSLNLSAAEVISTYVYKMGLLNRQYSYSAAIGMFNNVINFVLVITVNKIVKKLSGSGLW